MMKKGKSPKNTKVLLMGITFKENVSDIRNTKVVDLVHELESFSVKVDIADPFAETEELQHEYGLSLIEQPKTGDYDAVIVAVNHQQYLQLDEAYFEGLTSKDGIVVDIKGIYNKQFKNMNYWVL